ncbi:GIY-YIG nuclease family protein, partial [Pseudomonas sp.]|uniref:GIY-YIG nuclease family protein n=1 Tax=Pseudomonas sp. TaxID=306 RepID=UPI00258E6774
MSDNPLPPARTWYVYLVRAENQALYCGISDDPERRFAQHRSGRGARFFASSPAQALVYVWLGPVLTAVQHLVPAHMRATASASFLLIN